MSDSEKEKLEGFNAGYIIEKHRPELAKQLVEGLDGVDVPFIKGFVAGSNEFSLERNRSRMRIVSKLKGFSKGTISPAKKGKDKIDKDKGFEIDT